MIISTGKGTRRFRGERKGARARRRVSGTYGNAGRAVAALRGGGPLAAGGTGGGIAPGAGGEAERQGAEGIGHGGDGVGGLKVAGWEDGTRL